MNAAKLLMSEYHCRNKYVFSFRRNANGDVADVTVTSSRCIDRKHQCESVRPGFKNTNFTLFLDFKNTFLRFFQLTCQKVVSRSLVPNNFAFVLHLIFCNHFILLVFLFYCFIAYD